MSSLATGGDGFGVFNEGTDSLGGAQDIDAPAAAFVAAEPTGIAPPLDQIVAIASSTKERPGRRPGAPAVR